MIKRYLSKKNPKKHADNKEKALHSIIYVEN